MAQKLLTDEEREVIRKLTEAWEAFLELPRQHPMHNDEFAHHIHDAQRIVMARPVARDEGWVTGRRAPRLAVE